MTRRRGWLPYAVIVLVLGAALVASGLRQGPIRAFALGVPNQSPVVGLNRGDPPVCEGPITLRRPAAAVRIWARSVGMSSRVGVVVSRSGGVGSTAGSTLATGQATVTTIPDPYTAPLDRPLSAGNEISVCLSAFGASVALYGAPPAHPRILIDAGRRRLQAEFSLVLLSVGQSSLLGSLGTVADRASLFRWGWVGTWTFWLLGLALVAAVIAGGVAVAQAANADERDDALVDAPHRRDTAGPEESDR